MLFKIQASNPKDTNVFDASAENISEAIEASFPLETEYAIMIWNYIPILISYKYDISVIVDDILAMLRQIRSNSNGNMEIRWPSNTFESSWSIKWTEEIINIDSVWETVIGDNESLLNQRNNVNINKNEFIFEWKQILNVLISTLIKCGYNNELDGMTNLKTEFNNIDEYGVMYSSK